MYAQSLFIIFKIVGMKNFIFFFINVIKFQTFLYSVVDIFIMFYEKYKFIQIKL